VPICCSGVNVRVAAPKAFSRSSTTSFRTSDCVDLRVEEHGHASIDGALDLHHQGPGNPFAPERERLCEQRPKLGQ